MDRVLQWNCKSIVPKKHEIISLINSHNIFLLAISETWLVPGSNFRMAGFNILRHDRHDGYGGTALLIRNNHRFSSLPIPAFNSDILQAVAARVGEVTYLSVYISEKDLSVLPILDKIIQSLPKPIVVLGDFNAHHFLWGAPNDDGMGNGLMEIINDHNLCVLNDGSPTRRPVPGQAPSYVDITLSSASLSSLLNWECLTLSCGSDHYPLLISLPSGKTGTFNPLPPLFKFRLNNYDWELFSQEVESKIMSLPSLSTLDDYNNINKAYDNLITAYLAAADKHIPKKNVAHKKISSPPWWDKECTEAVNKRNDAEKLNKQCLTMHSYLFYKNVEAATKRLLRKKKKEGWKRFCSKLSPDSPSSLIWKNIRMFRSSFIAPSRNYTSQEWINPFLDNIAPTMVPKFDQLPYTYSYISDNSNINNNLACSFSLPELQLVLNRLSDSTPGCDGIPYSFLINSKPITLSYLLNLINSIIDTGIIPSSWKHQIIIPILKPNKDSNNPLSYRPVALSSVLVKLAEHLIKQRFEWYVEHNNLLPCSQYGFRRGKGVSDSHAIFATDIFLSFSKSESVVGAFLDIQSAYDNVNLIKLKEKMSDLKLPLKFIDFIFNLYTGRTISLHIPGFEDKIRKVWKGIPQGSVLSPLLYDIYTFDLHLNVDPSCSILQYADDVLVYSANRDIKIAAETLNDSLNKLSSWLSAQNLSLSKSKSLIVVFTRKRKVPTVNISVDGERIPVVKEAKFLGRIFDSSMNGNAHINDIVRKCEKNINIMRAVSGVWWGSHPGVLRLMYNALVRSILDFGSITFCLENKQPLHKLDLLQHKSLRIVIGAMNSTPINALQIECSEPPLSLRRQYLSDRFIFKIQQYHGHPLILKLQNLCEVINGRNAFWRNRKIPYLVSSYRRFLELRCSIHKFQCHSTFSYDYETLMFVPDIKLSIDIQKGSSSANSKLASFIKNLEPKSEDFYTDASKSVSSDEKSVGAAFLRLSSGHFRLYKYPHLSSNFVGEGMAVLECVKYIICNKIENSYIFSDSLSFLQSLLSNPFKKKPPCPLSLEVKLKLKECHDSNLRVTLAWIPGHSGIQGNELVDDLAAMAARQGNTYIDKVYTQDLLEKPREYLLKDWNSEWEKSCLSKGGRYRRLHIKINLKPWFSKFNFPKKVTSTISRLRFGHCSLPSHLSRIGVVDSDACEHCNTNGNIEHTLFECVKYKSKPLYEFLIKFRAPLPCDSYTILSFVDFKYTKALISFLTFHNILL